MRNNRRSGPPIFPDVPDENALHRFVELLNTKEYWSASLIAGRQRIGGDYRPIRDEMRQLVSAWKKSGPNVIKLFNSNPALSKSAETLRPVLIPTPGSTARLLFLQLLEYSDSASPREIAVELFLRFLINPHNGKLGGPCRYCGDYYFRATEHSSVYCSTTCGRQFTSRDSLKKARKRETLRKTEKAIRSIAKWHNDARSADWKEWVSQDTHISKNWLTRAVKGDLIEEPIKKGRKVSLRQAAK